MEPAIKLNREIIKELSRQLRDNSKQLRDSNKQLQRKEQKLERGIIKLIQRLKNEGKDTETVREALEDIFSLDKEEAEAKVELYWEKQ